MNASTRARAQPPSTGSTATLGADSISVRLRVADGYYLFANTLRVESADPGVELGEPGLPPAERYRDPFFGEVDAYRGVVKFSVPHRAGEQPRIEITVPRPGLQRQRGMQPRRRPRRSGGRWVAGRACRARKGRARAGEAARAGRKHRDRVRRGRVSRSRCRLRAECGGGRPGHDRSALGHRAGVTTSTATSSGSGLRKGRTPRWARRDFRRARSRTTSTSGRWRCTTTPSRRSCRWDGAAPGTALDVDVTYQGCAEAGLCYPPITKTVSLLIPAAMAASGGGGTSGSTGLPGLEVPGADGLAPLQMPEQDRIATALLSGNRWLVILSLFGAGLLLTFTPCVLPMVPILASLIVGQGSGCGSPGLDGPRVHAVPRLRAGDGAHLHRRRGGGGGCSGRTSPRRSRIPGSCRPSCSCSCCCRSRCSASTSCRFPLRGRRSSPR